MLALLEILSRQRVSHSWTVSLPIKIRPEFFDPQHLVNCGNQILRGTSLEREIDRHSEDFCHRELLKNYRLPNICVQQIEENGTIIQTLCVR